MTIFGTFNSGSFRRYLTNTLWMLLGRGISLALALLSSIVLARYLGPANFGLLQYAIAIASFVGLLTTLGFDAIIVRELVRHPDTAGNLLGTAAGLRAIAAIGLLGTLALVNWVAGHGPVLTTMVLLVGLSYLPLAGQVSDFLFQARVAARVGIIAQIAAVLAGAGWIIGGILLHAPAVVFAAQPLVECSLLVLGLWLAYRQLPGRPAAWQFDLSLARSLLRESWPLMFSLGLVSIYVNTDKIMVNALLGEQATGLYAAAVRLSEAWYFIPTIIVNSIFPAIVRAREISPAHYRLRLQNLYDLMVWLAVLLAIPVSFTAEWLMALLYGEAYRDAGAVLALHIWTGVFVFLGVASGRWFILEGYAKAYLGRTVVGVFGNALLNLLLLPRMGMIGAAWATLLAQVLVVLVFDALWLPSRENFRMKCRALFPVHWLKPSEIQNGVDSDQ